MTGNIATTLFQSGAKDDLAAVDIYSVDNTKVKTSFVDRLQNTASTVIDSIVSNPELLNTVASSLISVGKTVSFDKTSLLNSLASTSLGSKGRALGSTLSSDISSMLGDTLNRITSDPNLSQRMFSEVGNIKDDLCTSDYGRASSVTDFLSLLTGASHSSRSRNDEGSLLHSMLSAAIGNCQPAAFEAILDHYQGKDEYNQMVRGVMAGSFYNASMSGRIDINKSLVDRLGGPAVLAQTPNAGAIILNAYSFPYKLKPNAYREELTKMVELLNSIDPGWFSSIRKVQTIDSFGMVVVTDQPCINMQIFTTASQDAKELFMLDNTYKVAVMMAEEYPPIEAMVNLKDKYPKVFIR